MDISILLEEYKLNFRVSAIIKRNNEILLHHELNTNHTILPGGRVKEGENTIEAIKREIKEELGETVEVRELISFMENFFEDGNKKYHELLVTYEVKFENMQAYNREKLETIEEEKKGKLEFIWYPIEKLKEENFKPNKLIEIIKENKNHIYCINDERNK